MSWNCWQFYVLENPRNTQDFTFPTVSSFFLGGGVSRPLGTEIRNPPITSRKKHNYLFCDTAAVSIGQTKKPNERIGLTWRSFSSYAAEITEPISM